VYLLVLLAALVMPGFHASAQPPSDGVRDEQLSPWAVAALVAAIGVFWVMRERAFAARERRRLEDALQERERARLVFHDELLQDAQGLVLNMQVLAAKLPSDDQRRALLEALLDDADATIARARDGIPHRTNPKGGGLDPALALSTAGASLGRRIDAYFEIGVDDGPPALPAQLRALILDVVHEALVNAARDGRATRIRLLIRRRAGRVIFTVVDDHRGFDMTGTRAGREGAGPERT